MGADEFACPLQRRRVGRVASELQREVCFDGVAEMSRTAAIQRPAAIGRLGGEHVVYDARLEALRAATDEAIEDDELRVHGNVRLERRMPEPFRPLLRKEECLAARDG